MKINKYKIDILELLTTRRDVAIIVNVAIVERENTFKKILETMKMDLT